MSGTTTSTHRREAAGDRPTAGGSAPRERRSVGRVVKVVAENHTLLLATVAVFVFFSVLPATRDVFPSPQNLENVLGNQVVLIVVAMGLLFPLTCGEFDFSVGATATVASIVAGAAVARFGLPLAVAIVAAVLVGAVVGLLNAVLVTRIGVNGIITTLGLATVLGGLVTLYTQGAPIVDGIPLSLAQFGADGVAGVPYLALPMVVLVLAVGYFFAETPAGRFYRAVGLNRSASRLVGIPVRRVVLSSFVLSGTFAAAAGVALLARQGIASPQAGGTPLLLQALSAAFLGATTFRPGRFNVVGTLVAVLFLAFSVSGLSLAGADSWVNDVFTGGALVVAVAASTLLAKRRAGR